GGSGGVSQRTGGLARPRVGGTPPPTEMVGACVSVWALLTRMDLGPPQLKVTVPPPFRAVTSAASVQEPGVPVPTTPPSGVPGPGGVALSVGGSAPISRSAGAASTVPRLDKAITMTRLKRRQGVMLPSLSVVIAPHPVEGCGRT